MLESTSSGLQNTKKLKEEQGFLIILSHKEKKMKEFFLLSKQAFVTNYGFVKVISGQRLPNTNFFLITLTKQSLVNCLNHLQRVST